MLYKRIHIDWLQINYKRRNLTYPYDIKSTPFVVKKSPYLKSQLFTEVLEIEYNNKPFAIMPITPFDGNKIHKHSTIIKYDNAILYSPEFEKLYNLFIEIFDLEYTNITRLDLAHDFTAFDLCGDSPSLFLNKIASCQYTRVGNAKVSMIGKNNSNIKWQYLRYGGNTSDVSVYLYNKTEEMQAKKIKSYISQYHVEKCDYWRLEFSLKRNSIIDFKYTDQDGKEYMKTINEKTLFCPFHRTFFYEALVKKYFKIVDRKSATRVTRCKEVKLFTYHYISEVIIKNHTPDTTRKHKIFIKNLEEQNQLMRLLSKPYNLTEYIKDYVKTHNLEMHHLKVIDQIKEKSIRENLLRNNHETITNKELHENIPNFSTDSFQDVPRRFIND